MGENLLMHVSILRQHWQHLLQIARGLGTEGWHPILRGRGIVQERCEQATRTYSRWEGRWGTGREEGEGRRGLRGGGD